MALTPSEGGARSDHRLLVEMPARVVLRTIQDISPGSVRHDRGRKRERYQRTVPEYWVSILTHAWSNAAWLATSGRRFCANGRIGGRRLYHLLRLSTYGTNRKHRGDDHQNNRCPRNHPHREQLLKPIAHE